MSVYTLKVGTTKPLRVTLERSDGSPISLAAILSVTFTLLGEVDGLQAIVAAPVTILEGDVIPPGDDLYSAAAPTAVYPKGLVEYAWQAGETAADEAGLYRATFAITDAAGHVESVPNEGWFAVKIEPL